MAAARLEIAQLVDELVGGRRALAVRLFDVAAAVAAWPVAWALRQDLSLDRPLDLLTRDLVVVAIVAVVLLEASGAHRAFWRFATAADLARLAFAAGLVALTVTTALFLLDRLDGVPRAVPVLYGAGTFLFLAGARIGWMLLARRSVPAAAGLAAAPPPARPVLLVGAGEGAALAVQLLEHAAGPAYRPVAILDDAASLGRSVMGVPVVGRLADLGPTLARLQVQGLRPHRLLVTASPDAFRPEALRRLRERAYAERLPVDFLSDLVRLRWPEVDEPAADPTAPTPVEAQPAGALAYALAKRTLDTAAAAVALVLTAPLIAAIALSVALSIGRPVLFRQVRRGRALVPFTLYKFRTLADPIAPDGRLLPDEARQTPLGRLLRRTRLDELPQLWNVLVGDMAIVGPRPLVDADLAALPDGGRERARVRPGLTGWAQVNGGQVLGPLEKHALDLWYIRHASPALDARILWRTLVMVVRGDRVDERAVRRALAALEQAAEVGS